MMSKFMTLSILSFLLLTGAACSNETEENTASNASENETEETEAESEETASDNDAEEDTIDSDHNNEASESEETSPFSPVSQNDKEIIEQKYEGRTNDDFISSIEAQDEEYSELVVHVTDISNNMNEEGYRSKLEGIGTSIREMTSGVLYNDQEGTLPTLEIKDADDEVIGSFNSHDRDERMEFDQ